MIVNTSIYNEILQLSFPNAFKYVKITNLLFYAVYVLELIPLNIYLIELTLVSSLHEYKQ